MKNLCPTLIAIQLVRNITGFSFSRIKCTLLFLFFYASFIKNNKAFPITWFFDVFFCAVITIRDRVECLRNGSARSRWLYAYAVAYRLQYNYVAATEREIETARCGMGERKREKGVGEGEEREREGHICTEHVRTHTHSLHRGALSRESTNGWKRNVNKQVALYPNQIAGE